MHPLLLQQYLESQDLIHKDDLNSQDLDRNSTEDKTCRPLSAILHNTAAAAASISTSEFRMCSNCSIRNRKVTMTRKYGLVEYQKFHYIFPGKACVCGSVKYSWLGSIPEGTMV